MIGYRWWRGRDGLGLGDIKLAAVAGAWLSFVTVFAAVELATLSALGAYFVSGYLQQASGKSNGAASVRAVSRAGDLDRLAGRGDVGLASLSCLSPVFGGRAAADA